MEYTQQYTTNIKTESKAPSISTVGTIGILIATIAGYFVMQVVGALFVGLLRVDAKSYTAQFITAVPVFLFYMVIIRKVMKKRLFAAKGNGIICGIAAGGFMIYLSVSSLLNELFITADEKGMAHYTMPSGLTFGSEQVWCILAVLLSAGICEELMCRGIILNVLRDRFGRDTFNGTVKAIIVSGVIFGCMHFVNLIAGVPLSGVLVQVVSVTGMGFLIGAIYCRCGNIKVCMFLHFFMDICILLPNSMKTGNGLVEALTDTINPKAIFGIVIYTAVTVFLLRKSVRHELFSYSDV